MRTIQTFILRVLVNTEQRVLRGTLRAVEEETEQPFVGEQALLDLLRAVVVESYDGERSEE